MTVRKQLVRVTHAIASEYGVRYCTKCNRTRPAEGGRTKLITNGKTRWECAGCVARKTVSPFTRKNKEST